MIHNEITFKQSMFVVKLPLFLFFLFSMFVTVKEQVIPRHQGTTCSVTTTSFLWDTKNL